MLSKQVNSLVSHSLRLLFDRVHGKPPLPLETADEDEDVRGERERVESGKADFDTLQLQNLTKIYHLPHKRIVAVKNLSIGIPAGEVSKQAQVASASPTEKEMEQYKRLKISTELLIYSLHSLCLRLSKSC